MSNGKKYRLRPIKVGNLAIQEGRSVGEPSAIIEIEDNNGGFLTARLTTAQRDAIESPAEGLLIWNLDTGQFENYSNTGTWDALGSGGGGGAVASVFGRSGNVISQTGDYNASQITVTPGGNLTATEVQSALLELQLDIDLLNSATPVNMYTTDGALTADRTIDAATNDLSIQNFETLGVASFSPTSQIFMIAGQDINIGVGGGNITMTAGRTDFGDLIEAEYNGSIGTTGQVLASRGAGLSPEWITISGATDTTIYDTDGTLTGDRVVTMGTNELDFVGATTTFTILNGGFTGGGDGQIQNMNVATDLTVGNDATVNNDLSVANDAVVGGNTNLNGNLDVAGLSSFTGNVTMASDLAVSGNTAVAGEVSAVGRVTSDLGIGVTNSGFVTGFSAPTLAASQIYVLPAADGTAGQQLTTDASGNLSWDEPFVVQDADGDTFLITEQTPDDDIMAIRTGPGPTGNYISGVSVDIGPTAVSFTGATPIASGVVDGTSFIFTTGAGAATGGTNSGGNFEVITGVGPNGSGEVNLTTGDAAGAGADTGDINITTGSSGNTAISGSIRIATQAAGRTGSIVMETETGIDGGASGGATGDITIRTGSTPVGSGGLAGDVTIVAGNTEGAGPGGNIILDPGTSGNGSALYGRVRLTAHDATDTTELSFEDGSGGSVRLKAPTAIGGDVTLTLPNSDGNANEVLTTNGTGALSWAAPGAATLEQVLIAGSDISLADRTITVTDRNFTIFGVANGGSPTAGGGVIEVRSLDAVSGREGYLDLNSDTGEANLSFGDGFVAQTGMFLNSTGMDLRFEAIGGTQSDLRLDGAAGTAGQVLTSNGPTAAPTWEDASSSSPTFLPEANTSFSATINSFYPVDVSAGPVTVTAPPSPSAGDIFTVVDSRGNAGTNNITIDFTTGTQNLHGSVDNWVMNADRDYAEFVFINATIGWIVKGVKN